MHWSLILATIQPHYASRHIGRFHNYDLTILYIYIYIHTRLSYFNCEHILFIKEKKTKNFTGFIKKILNIQKSNFVRVQFLKPHNKFGPDLFSRFDVYMIQTDNPRTDKQSIYI